MTAVATGRGAYPDMACPWGYASPLAPGTKLPGAWRCWDGAPARCWVCCAMPTGDIRPFSCLYHALPADGRRYGMNGRRSRDLGVPCTPRRASRRASGVTEFDDGRGCLHPSHQHPWCPGAQARRRTADAVLRALRPAAACPRRRPFPRTPRRRHDTQHGCRHAPYIAAHHTARGAACTGARLPGQGAGGVGGAGAARALHPPNKHQHVHAR